MSNFLSHLLPGGFVFATVTICVIALTLFDTPKEKIWSDLGKNRLVGFLIVLTGAIGVAVIK